MDGVPGPSTLRLGCVSGPDSLERLTLLEKERDILRERLSSFERGEPAAAHRAELKQLEGQYEALVRENDQLRRRIDERQQQHRKARAEAAGRNPLLAILEAVLRTLTGSE